MVDLICKCGKEWDYKGNMKHYATCPDCKSPVKIIKNNEENENGKQRDEIRSEQRKCEEGNLGFFKEI